VDVITETTGEFLRGRRLRQRPALRRLVRETRLDAKSLIQPLFVCPGVGVREAISTLPGQFHLSPDQAAEEALRAAEVGVGAVLLFGLPASKDAIGSSGLDEKGPVPEACRLIRQRSPETVVITDVCLCEYTDHGHCGLIDEAGRIDNDRTLAQLSKMALVHAEAGAEIVAPSDMMDGRVLAIRRHLDQVGFTDTAIMSYAAKHASAFYGPFREAAQSTPAFGDRRTYQMDPANGQEAMREILADQEEGADLIIVKPAITALDLIARARRLTLLPIVAYQVSGEAAMIEAAAERGWLNRKDAILESLTAIQRAGAHLTISYFAQEVARWLGGR
jgi:porphobilinogen synthase